MDDRAGLGPKDRMVSVNRETTSANRGASADETHSKANRLGSMPSSARTMLMTSALAFAL